ncbi:PREDICTED: kallikrein-11 [Condylura cristata]|uniref:kallikrein-11 n=1 Tax=Condylura cristata TaxID=143302 RepID=UPI0006428C61|nr:PREDICTED: kallikrein-11 [Condylura cristata]
MAALPRGRGAAGQALGRVPGWPPFRLGSPGADGWENQGPARPLQAMTVVRLIVIALVTGQVGAETRIIKGYECAPHSQPWQVALFQKTRLLCGATLIAPRWLLTAAHCRKPWSAPPVHLPHALRCANITIIAHRECEDAYPGNITDTMVCASVREEGKDSCQGDSGGPLVCDGSLQGIISWGQDPCAVTRKPGVYTKVCKYVDWIRETMKNN